MKNRSLFRMMQERAEARLRRLCGRIPIHLRLYVVLTMLLFFAFLTNYVFFNGLYRIFSDGDTKEEALPSIKHIEAPEVRRLYPNDSINLLKYYDYVPIQKKDSLRYEYLA
ncbi:conjugal transfer protein TraL [Porphyromonas canoris]|uniref:TraL conjugative transposon family protein n=1 Tax=Porphyromonas canoris TaxID=36875 RepID=UPI00051DFE2F|nr:TraL conjugative transposon family protein [Porphyromonas canoris]KGL52519.1 conjugal transfer protein TraL [Porphyromonas canoris]